MEKIEFRERPVVSLLSEQGASGRVADVCLDYNIGDIPFCCYRCKYFDVCTKKIIRLKERGEGTIRLKCVSAKQHSLN